MSTKSLLHQARLNEWATRITEQKSSGLSVVEWCRQNNTSKDKFFYWKRLLKDEAFSQMLPEIVPLAMGSSVALPSQPQSTSPAHTSGCTTCTSCTTFTPNSCARISINGITIELDSSASEHFIRSLIKAVRYA